VTGEIILADLQTEKPDRNARNGEVLGGVPSMDRAWDKARMLMELSIFQSSFESWCWFTPNSLLNTEGEGDGRTERGQGRVFFSENDPNSKHHRVDFSYFLYFNKDISRY
jgi:hypothetical protein